MNPFVSNQRLIHEVLKGRMPSETLAREAKAEVEAALRDHQHKPAENVLQQLVSAHVQKNNDVTMTEAMASLESLFLLMEATIRKMKREDTGDFIITGEVADVFIDARTLLGRYGCDSVNNRRDHLVLKRIKGAPR